MSGAELSEFYRNHCELAQLNAVRKIFVLASKKQTLRHLLTIIN